MFSDMSDHDDDGMDDGSNSLANPVPKKEKRIWARGTKSTPEKRVAQFADVMEIRDSEMWCHFCNVPVDHREKCIAANHLNGKRHIAAVKAKPKMVHRRAVH